MVEFTQQEIQEFGKIAESMAKGNTRKETHFIGIEDERAVYGVRFIAPGKVGLPVFIKIGKDGVIEKITDRDEKFRLLDIMNKQS